MNGRVASSATRPTPNAIASASMIIVAQPLRYWLPHAGGRVDVAARPAGRSTVAELVPETAARGAGRAARPRHRRARVADQRRRHRRALHPRYGCERVCRDRARRADARDAAALANGIELDDAPPRRHVSARRSADGAAATFHLVLREGRKRQIRRSLAVLGHCVLRLIRVRMGPLELGDLPPSVASARRRRAPTAAASRGAVARERSPGVARCARAGRWAGRARPGQPVSARGSGSETVASHAGLPPRRRRRGQRFRAQADEDERGGTR